MSKVMKTEIPEPVLEYDTLTSDAISEECALLRKAAYWAPKVVFKPPHTT